MCEPNIIIGPQKNCVLTVFYIPSFFFFFFFVFFIFFYCLVRIYIPLFIIPLFILQEIWKKKMFKMYVQVSFFLFFLVSEEKKKGDIALTWVVISMVLKTSMDKESKMKLLTDFLVQPGQTDNWSNDVIINIIKIFK